MKVILERLWTEPAYFTGTVATLGVVLLQIVSLPDYIEIPLSGLFVLGGAHVTRQNVKPIPRRKHAR